MTANFQTFRVPETSKELPDLDLAGIVECIGSEQFASSVLEVLDAISGADFCAFYRLRNYELVEIATAGNCGADSPEQNQKQRVHDVKRHMMSVGSSVRVDTLMSPSNSDPETENQADQQKTLISVRRGKDAFCIYVLRSGDRPEITNKGLEGLSGTGWFLLASVAKHAALTLQRPDLAPALTCLDEIHACVSTAADLSRREGEVCARILYGLSSCGIALDLGIGKESVMTYRKRAYSRLGIASQRELLMWYLGTWSKQSCKVVHSGMEATAA